jgi:hypothetical protein
VEPTEQGVTSSASTPPGGFRRPDFEARAEEPDRTTSRQDRDEGALIGVALIILGLALMPVQQRWAYNFQLIEYDRHFWMTMLIVFLGTVAAAEAAWRVVLRRPCKVSPIIGFAATVAAYNVFYPIANGALDRNEADQRVYVIAARDCNPLGRGEGGRAILWLQSQDPPDHRLKVRVPRRFCRDAHDGQELLLELKPGFLNTAWVARYELGP